MGCTICVPYPIICIERQTIIIMYPMIERAEIAPVFADTDWAFKYPVQRSIKYPLTVSISSLNVYLAQGSIPDIPPFISQCHHIITGQFTFHVFASLFFTDKWNTVSYTHILSLFCKGQHRTRIVTFCSRRTAQFPIHQHVWLYWHLLSFQIQIDSSVVIQMLVTTDMVFRYLNFSVLGIHNEISRFVRLGKAELV